MGQSRRLVNQFIPTPEYCVVVIKRMGFYGTLSLRYLIKSEQAAVRLFY